MLLANVIFPAFASVYILELNFWKVSLLAFTIEVSTVYFFLTNIDWRDVASVVLIANLISAIVGFFLMYLLPHGLEASTNGMPQYAPIARTYALAGFPVACLLSILIESLTTKLLISDFRLIVLLKAFTLANLASYLLILAAVLLFDPHRVL